MGKREETVELIWQGKTPGEIARTMGVNIKTTLAYLDQMVGQGCIRRSDILLTIPAERRRKPIDPNDQMVVLKYGEVSKLLGDVYEDVRFIETSLHDHIKCVLEATYGPGEAGWWRASVPENIRQECVNRREEDKEPVDPYCYTDLLDLKTILDKQWAALGQTLPKKMASDKKKLIEDLVRLNEVRRVVMHPVRGVAPSEEDFDFLRRMRREMESIDQFPAFGTGCESASVNEISKGLNDGGAVVEKVGRPKAFAVGESIGKPVAGKRRQANPSKGIEIPVLSTDKPTRAKAKEQANSSKGIKIPVLSKDKLTKAKAKKRANPTDKTSRKR